MNIFYQLIGFGALIAMGLSYWQNDKRTILLWQVVANLIFAIHYTLLHAYSGALCSFFQIVVLLLFLLQEKFNWSKLVTAIPIVAVFLLIAVVTYETPVTVLPIVASLAALLPFFQSRRRVIQVAGIASGLSWLVYVIAVRSYSGMVTESVLTIITAASVVGGLGVLGGAVAHVVRIVQRDKRQSAAIKAMQEEQTIICYGLRGALQGLIESGCNGPCKDALGKLDKHLNQKAHTSSTEV